MVLGVLGEEEAPFSRGVLSPFRERLIEHEMDRRLLERTVELAKRTGGFDFKKLPKTLRLAVDSRPLSARGESELDVADWTNETQKGDALSRLLVAIAALEEWVRKELGERADRPPVAQKLATLAQLREQDLDPEPPSGGKQQIREGVAPDRRVSISDPDMRHGRKSHLATDLDRNLVMACAMTRANRPEAEGLDSMKDDLTRGTPCSRIRLTTIDSNRLAL